MGLSCCTCPPVNISLPVSFRSAQLTGICSVGGDDGEVAVELEFGDTAVLAETLVGEDKGETVCGCEPGVAMAG